MAGVKGTEQSGGGRVAFSHLGPCCVGSAGDTGVLGMKGSPARWSGHARREQKGRDPRVWTQRSLRPSWGLASRAALSVHTLALLADSAHGHWFSVATLLRWDSGRLFSCLWPEG